MAIALALTLLLWDSILLTSDAVLALAWGDELARGGLPDTAEPLLPVFHPLPTAFGALLSPLGPDVALDAYRLSSTVAMTGLLYAAYRLASGLGGALAGVVVVGLVLTRPEIHFFIDTSVVDIPFAALVLLATALALERPVGNRWWVLSLLAVAGLLRPEGWAFALAYGAWIALRMNGWERVAVLTLSAAAPVVWLGADLAFTGDPLSSVEQASRVFSANLEDAGFPVAAGGGADPPGVLELHWNALTAILGTPLAIGGVAAAIWALLPARLRPGARTAEEGSQQGPRSQLRAGPELDAGARARIVAMLSLGVLIALLALRIADLSFADRFLLPPAIALLVLYASALVRFSPPWPWRLAVAAVAVAVLATLPGDVDEILDDHEAARSSGQTLQQVRELTGSDEVLDAMEECPRAAAGGDIFVTLGLGVLAMHADRDPSEIPIEHRPGPEFETVLLYNGAEGVGMGTGPEPRSLVAREGLWQLWSRCAS